MSENWIMTGPGAVTDWEALRALLVRAFAYMKGRIDPPSSLDAMTAADLRRLAETGFVVTAGAGDRLLACGFATETGDAFYLTKLAVEPGHQGRGLLRAMLGAIEAEARARGLGRLTLQSRVELADSHAAFQALGFVKTGGSSHPGYSRPTSWHFEKRL